MPAIYLSDVIRALGWPIDLPTVAQVLQNADEVLAADGGRKCRRALTDAELIQLGVERDNIPPREPVDRQWPIRISADLHQRIRACADAAGLPMNTWGSIALRASVEAQEKEGE